MIFSVSGDEKLIYLWRRWAWFHTFKNIEKDYGNAIQILLLLDMSSVWVIALQIENQNNWGTEPNQNVFGFALWGEKSGNDGRHINI